MAHEGSQASLVLGVIIFTLALSGLVVALRVYARVAVNKGTLGLDDLFIVLSWFLVLASSICNFVAIGNGFGERMKFLSLPQYSQVVEDELIGQFFALLTYVPAKISVCICLGKVFPGRLLRIVLWTVAVLNGLAFLACGILFIAQCDPPAKQWNPTIEGKCISPIAFVDYGLFTGVFGAFCDFVLALIPWYYIRRLQLVRREKAAVGVAMSLGVIAGCFAIVKSYYITTLGSQTDYAYDTIPLVLWAVGEQSAIVIAASIPMLRPLVRHVVSSKGTSDKRRSTQRLPTSTRMNSKYRESKYRGRGGQFSGSDDIGLVEQAARKDGEIWVESRIEVSSEPMSGRSSDPSDKV